MTLEQHIPWVAALALEVVFLGLGFFAAWKVMQWRVRVLEEQLHAHLTEANDIRERLVRVETKIDMALQRLSGDK